VNEGRATNNAERPIIGAECLSRAFGRRDETSRIRSLDPSASVGGRTGLPKERPCGVGDEMQSRTISQKRTVKNSLSREG
jgi:hypothetical protein